MLTQAPALGHDRGWNTAVLDWEARILSGRSLVPELPLFKAEAARGLRVFKRLRLPDVIGTPTMGEVCGPWFFPIVEALFGSYDPATNTRHISEVFQLIPKGNSKALALDTPVATPFGFTAIGKLLVGDTVFGVDGRPTVVMAKSPVFIGHRCFEVTFSTGEKVVCDAGHLWVTDSHRDRDRRRPARAKRTSGTVPYPTVKTTEEIGATLKVKSGQYVINNHRTAIAGALDLPEAALVIPPYALGVWLGDGTTTQSTVTSSALEADHIVERLVANGQPAYVRGYKKDNGAATIQLGIRNTVNHNLPYRFRTEAIRLGLLGNKHIPQTYLRAAKEQRLQLLQGLMDTDGSISKAGQATFTTTLPRLMGDVRELVNSLGFKSSVSEHRAKIYGRDCGPVWNIQFWPFDTMPVFTLPRKLTRQWPRVPQSSSIAASRQIVDIRPVASVPVQCISVADDSKQFLITRSFLPTHNSSNGGAVMLTALIVNRRPEAEFMFVAPTMEIAAIAYKQAKGTIKLDAELTKIFHVQDNFRRITHRQSGATLQIKAADTDVITGSKCCGTMIDETHQFSRKSNAADVFIELRGALTKRPDGFLFQTTTQSKTSPSGVFASELAMARAVRDGQMQMPLLPVLYELPDRLARDGGWKQRKYWPLVNPNLGRSTNEDFLAREVMRAEADGPGALALIASQHFNVQIGMSLRVDGWAGARYWEAAEDPALTLDEILLRSEVVVVGIDGGGLDDLFGLAVVGRCRETSDWLVWMHAWCHRSVLEQRKAIAGRLLQAQAAGELTVVEHAAQDIEEIVELIASIRDKKLLACVAVDPAGLGEFIEALRAIQITQEGEQVVGAPQGYQLMNAIKTSERKLENGTLKHAPNALAAWCVDNVRIEPTATAIRATKQIAGDAKIDPVMALFDAVTVMVRDPKPHRAPEYQLFFA